MNIDKVLGAAASLRGWSLDRLREYLRIPSVSAQHRGIDGAAAWVEAQLRDMGFQVERLQSGGNPVVLAERSAPEANRSILYYDHYDVQPEDPVEEWESPPFEPTIRDGKLYARGTSDNKGNLVSRLAAVKAFQEAGERLPVTVRFLVEGEEEVGSPSLPAFMEEHGERIRSELCIWETGGKTIDGDPKMILGCKGVMHVELRCQGPRDDMHSSRGVTVENPAWRIAWALNALKGPDETIAIQGFYDGVVPPTESELAELRRMPYNEEAMKQLLGIRQFVKGLIGEELKRRLIFEPALNINGLLGGYQGSGSKTVLPKQAGAKLDVRLVPNQTPDELGKKIRRHLDARGFEDVELVDQHGYPPARTPIDDPMVDLVERAVRAAYRREPVKEMMMPGSGPMYLFTRLMPCCGLGTAHADSRGHAPNESIKVEDFHQGVDCQVHLLAEMAVGSELK